MGIFIFVEKGRGFFGLNFWESQMGIFMFVERRAGGFSNFLEGHGSCRGLFQNFEEIKKCLVITNFLGHTHFYRREGGFSNFCPLHPPLMHIIYDEHDFHMYFSRFEISFILWPCIVY